MMPRDTIYRLAHTPADYRRCHRLLRDQGQTAVLSWPTVMAERRGHLMGFFSTHPTREALVAGPLVVNGVPIRSFLAMRLCEAYEVVLRKAGMKFYYVWVPNGDLSLQWRGVLEKLQFEPYAADDARMWYMRRL